ncbi:MAG TPA: SPFH domain-containing protein [Blastocatellia bacterium]|nr:SPFH domain-containing protein [Blastocatellia bacterium]
MFGIRFIRVQPTTYLLQYRDGKVVREGAGMSFFYYAPTSSLVAIPMASTDAPFIFNEVTNDFQEVALQGQATYRVADPKRLSQLLNFTLDAFGRNYVSDDSKKLPQRVINIIKVLTRKQVEALMLKEALRASDAIARQVLAGLAASAEVTALGIEIIGLSILAIKPTPETARALEADAREQLLKMADEAIYARRNSAVEQERAIKENELNTEIAVENKKRQIREAQMDAERAVQEKQHQLLEADMASKISLEEKNKQLVSLAVENARAEADAKAYAMGALMKALEGVDSRTIQALATAGMQPDQLLALSFLGLADKAERIGELNLSPDLMKELINRGSQPGEARPRPQPKKK